ncbi:MAG: sulfite oxidase-like oxidoreductase [Acidimicrobiia bacterium]|nr:sulfite oxidase-like oxidoreductase [Acidimicrobiia bacterium]
MSLFKPGKVDIAKEGIDPARVPPGQYVTDRFPVLHAGIVPTIDLEHWDFRVDGLVAETTSFSLAQIKAMPTVDVTTDIHCVTKWSKLDTNWHGVRVADFLANVEVAPQATHVLIGAEHGFTANLPIADLVLPDNLLAWEFGGTELELEHGWPLRLVVPHLYFWKSVKWVRSLTFLAADQPGFWERNGYHMYGDPFKEQRYWGS